MAIEGMTTVVPKLEGLKQDAKNQKVNTRSPEFSKLRNEIIDEYAHLFQSEDGTKLKRLQVTNRIKSWRQYNVIQVQGQTVLRVKVAALETGVVIQRTTKMHADHFVDLIVPDKESLGGILYDLHTSLGTQPGAHNYMPGHHKAQTMFDCARVRLLDQHCHLVLTTVCVWAWACVSCCQNKYVHINLPVCEAFVSSCPHCVAKLDEKPCAAKAGHSPITSTYMMERVQVDLICLASALPAKNAGYHCIVFCNCL